MSETRNKPRSNELFQSVFEAATSGLCIINEEGILIEVNSEFCTICGLKKNELTGNHFTKAVPRERRDEIKKLHACLMAGGQGQESEPIGLEFECKKADCVNKWVRVTGKRIVIESGEVRLIGTVERVSERKRVDEDNLNLSKELQAIKERFNYALKASEDVIYDHDMVDDTIVLSDNFQDIFGYTFTDKPFTLEEWAKLLHPDDEERINNRLEKTLADKNEKRWEAEFRYAKYDGTYADVKENAYIIRDENGKPVRMVGVVRDITERKLNEVLKTVSSEISQVFNEEETLQSAKNRALDVICTVKKVGLAEIWLVDSDNEYINLAASLAVNDKMEMFYQKTSDLKQFARGDGLPGKTWETKQVQYWRNIDKRKSFLRREAATEVGLKTAFGIPILYNEEILGALVVGLSEDTKPEQNYLPLFRELCEQLGSELSRKRLEEELARIFESAPDGIIVAGFNGYFKKVNPAMCNMLGYSEKELLSRPYFDFVHPEDREKTIKFYENVNSGDEKSHFENRYITKSGKVVWLSWTFKIFRKEKIAYIVAKDVTVQKELEELINQSNRLAKIGSWEVDFGSKKMFWTDVTREIHETEPGFEPDIETGINFYKKGKSRENIRKAVNRAIEKGTGWDLELQIVTAKGNERWVRAIGEAEFVDGKCTKLYGSFQDIHDIKSTELRLQNMTNNLPGVVFQYHMKPNGDDEMIYISDMASEVWGYSKEEASEKLDEIWGRVHKDDFEPMWDSIINSAESLNRWHCIWRYLHPDGTTRWLEGFGTPNKRLDGSTVFDAIILDITEKKELEELLAQSNRMAKIGSWDNNLLTGDVFWSDSAREIFEVEEDEVPQLDQLLDLIGRESQRNRLKNAVEKAIQEGIPYDLELIVRTNKGNEKWIRTICEPEFRDGKCIRLYGSVQDIHDRKTAEEDLKIKSQHIEAISRLNNALINYEEWFTALEQNLEIIGEAVKADRVYYFENRYDPDTGEGYSTQKLEWCREGIEPQMDNDDLEDMKFSEYPDLFDRLLKGEPSTAVYSSVDEDSPIKHILESQQIKTFLTIPIVIDGKFHGFVGFDNCTDEQYWSDEEYKMLSTITSNLAVAIERANADETLKRLYREKNTILESIGDAFFAVDTDWTVTYWNNMAEKYLGMPKENIIGKHLWDVYEDAIELDFYKQYHKAVEKQVTVHFEEFYPATGNWFEVSAYPSASGLSVFFKDVTERKKADEQLKELNRTLSEKTKALEASNAELEQFAFVASHDLQEPLRMVTSFMAQLERKYDDVLDDRARKYIYFAIDGAKRMRQIILDLLDYSRVGRMDLEREEVDLNEVLDQVLLLNKNIITESKAEVHSDRLPKLTVSKVPFQQLFQNLINNAIKYQKAGSTPRVEVKAKERENEWLFTVKDNGIGIPSEYQEKIFNIFQRLHGKEEYTGTGMGLAICKKIVEEHGGEIWVESEPDKGSEFHFKIPK